MNKKRLLKLADLLEADAKDKKGIKFNMETFGVVKDMTAPTSCGTNCCAMGLAGLSGAFKRAGLEADLELVPDESAQLVTFRWKGRRVHGFTAAQRLFGINNSAAHYLFGIHSVSPARGAEGERKLAKKIRDFVCA